MGHPFEQNQGRLLTLNMAGSGAKL
jgi:hypothetical protein